MMSDKNLCDRRSSTLVTGFVLAVALVTACVGSASGQGGGGGSGGGTGASASGGSGAAAQSSGGAGPRGSTTVGRPGNPAGGTNIGRIDGTVTPGPSLQGDDQIRSESSQNSEADRKIKSICKGC